MKQHQQLEYVGGVGDGDEQLVGMKDDGEYIMEEGADSRHRCKDLKICAMFHYFSVDNNAFLSLIVWDTQQVGLVLQVVTIL